MLTKFMDLSGRLAAVGTLCLIDVLCLVGCQTIPLPAMPAAADTNRLTSLESSPPETVADGSTPVQIVQTALHADTSSAGLQIGGVVKAEPTRPNGEPKVAASAEGTAQSDLSRLESLAASGNPRLKRLLQKANAAAARTRYIDRLPDPTFGANIFGHPVETAAGSQRANLTVKQMIPWVDRLEARQQQACFEAMALRQEYDAERLRVIAEVRSRYYKLYVLTRQIEYVEASQKLLQTLIDIATARVATGNAEQGDILLGTVELSRREEQLISLRQRVRSTQAGINRLVSFPAATPIMVPGKLAVADPSWSHQVLVQTAWERQPLIAAAQLQANATRWGVDAAELQRRPDLHVGVAWFCIDDNRSESPVVDVGRDAWSIGASVTIPLDHTKYDAIRDEALWRHASSTFAVKEIRQEFDARLLDLLEQATAAAKTAELYRKTIIPLSEQTLAANQESLANGNAEFDRVIQDFRNLLTLKFEYHQKIGELATVIAEIQQAVGVDLRPVSS